MVKCLLCGREFKNEAGLSGHIRMAHPSASTVDGHKLEARLGAVEVALKSLTKWLNESENRLDKALIRSTALYILHAEVGHGVKHDLSETPELKIMVEKLKRG